ncbi:imidazole glycerol phosphate synthase subunit HisH [Conexibacter sp. S30A1]|uniref:imidazole glycerol phosphate synthase subunit HisH n=1 Tax=Conexibacter sp. S30A1 TaxID=2937800 RepID=UPI00200C88B8|nr:imidazole glycerol phosphate synthase subunit HisH [Conexibacter sp. S30A1]
MSASPVPAADAPRIAVVDYDMGNRRSVEKALAHVGAQTVLTRDPQTLADADALVLPGVGAFPSGASSLRRYGLDVLLRERVSAGTPLLGICLGMQLLFDSSDELGVETPGLGLVPGRVRALRAGGLRLPHIGWSDVRIERPSPLSSRLPATGAPFYHVHSYVAEPAREQDVVGTAEYGERFATLVAHGQVYGTQFHPEKSSRDGLSLLAAFAALARDRRVQAVSA